MKGCPLTHHLGRSAKSARRIVRWSARVG